MSDGSSSAGGPTGWEIRPFQTLEEYRACIELQEEVWGAGFSERVPVAILKVANRLGGIAAGAWSPDGGLAGFVFGLTGLEDGTPVHWSDMLAVRTALRDSGLGARLKAYQRKWLLERGVTTVYWTFDPLESKNAYLNFGRLGILVREYVPDMYGRTDSHLHRGIGTDRFVAIWILDSPRVRERIGREREPPGEEALEGAAPGLTVGFDDGDPVPETGPAPDPGGPVATPIPRDIHDLKRRRPELAARWRERTREVFTRLLDRGHEIRELVPGLRVSRYLSVPRGVGPERG